MELERVIAKLKSKLDDLEHERDMLDPECLKFLRICGCTPRGLGMMVARNYQNDREAHKLAAEIARGLSIHAHP